MASFEGGHMYKLDKMDLKFRRWGRNKGIRFHINSFYKKNRRYCKMMLKKGEEDIPLIPYSWYY
jgi:hypothetical protein